MATPSALPTEAQTMASKLDLLDELFKAARVSEGGRTAKGWDSHVFIQLAIAKYDELSRGIIEPQQPRSAEANAATQAQPQESARTRQEIYDILNRHYNHRCFGTRSNPCPDVTRLEALLAAEHTRGARELAQRAFVAGGQASVIDDRQVIDSAIAEYLRKEDDRLQQLTDKEPKHE